MILNFSTMVVIIQLKKGKKGKKLQQPIQCRSEVAYKADAATSNPTFHHLWVIKIVTPVAR